MQQIVVKPPAAAARVPVSMSSLYSWPGSRRWTWRSIRPGHDPQVLDVDDPAADEAAADLDDPAVRDPDIGGLIDGTRRRRVEHPAAAQDQIAGIHRSGS